MGGHEVQPRSVNTDNWTVSWHWNATFEASKKELLIPTTEPYCNFF